MIYDVLIVGGGASGYSAAVYAARFGLKTLIVTAERGGLLTKTHLVENWPGEKRISGLQLMKKIEEHALDYPDQVTLLDGSVKNIKKEGKTFVAFVDDTTYTVKSVILATGTKRKELGIPGEKELYGKGVSYCATCDGPFFRNKVIGVIGGSDSAAKEALLLSEYGSKVYIIYRKEKIRAEPINAKRVEENSKIEIINFTNVVKVNGENMIESVELDKEYNGSKTLALEGLFIFIGQIPQNDLAKQMGVKLNEQGEVIIDRNSKTNVEGVFAAGDIADAHFKQAITGASEGVIAAFGCYDHIQHIQK